MDEFRYEAEMTAVAATWLRDQGLVVHTEYPTPLGICDLVGVQLDRSRARARLQLGQRTPVTDVRKLALLGSMPLRASGRAATITELTRACDPDDVGDLAAGAAWLLRHRYAIATSDGGYQSQAEWAPLERRIVALELKLDDLAGALRQAEARLTFATESLMGFPEGRAIAIAATYGARLQALGVGLLAVNRDGCRLLVSCGRSIEQPHQLLRAQCVERFWPDFTRELRA